MLKIEVIKTVGYDYVNLKTVVPSGSGTRVINANVNITNDITVEEATAKSINKLKSILNRLKLHGTMRIVKNVIDESKPQVVRNSPIPEDTFSIQCRKSNDFYISLCD